MELKYYSIESQSGESDSLGFLAIDGLIYSSRRESSHQINFSHLQSVDLVKKERVGVNACRFCSIQLRNFLHLPLPSHVST